MNNLSRKKGKNLKKYRVSTNLKNLEKSENIALLEKSGNFGEKKCLKSRKCLK